MTTCEKRITKSLEGRLDDLHTLLNADDSKTEELGSLYDYGLSVDYVAPNTFEDQEEGYLRYQFSWGGPSDELRFYLDNNNEVREVEYWFLDWNEGANRNVTNDKRVEEVIRWLEDMDTFRVEREKIEETM